MENNNIIPEVSVICTAYNHGETIRDTLEGFVSQKTDFPFEVIVHDDASNDSTADIIREYEKKYPDIIKPIYQTENQYSKKIKVTKTYCMPKAKGKFIAFCEGDDYWTDPLKLQKQYDFMNTHPDYTLCTCSADWLNMVTGDITAQGKTKSDRDISLDEIILEKNGRIFVYVSYFMKREIYDELPDWKFPIGDYPLAINAALHGKVHMLADTMCVYRWNSAGSWTERMNSDKKRAEVSRNMIDALKRLDKYTEFKHTDVIRKRINKHRYTLALMTNNFGMIKNNPELYAMYKNRNILYKISDRLHCSNPKLFHVVHRMFGKSK